MIRIDKVRYRVIGETPTGEELDLTGAASNLSWSEGEKELASKITFKLGYVSGLESQVTINTPVKILADEGGGWAEVIRGKVQKLVMTEANGEFSLNVECADECHELRHTQEDYYFTDDHTSRAILEKILNDAGLVYEIKVEDVTHSKKVYRGKYLADMVGDVLRDMKEKSGKVYFIRAKGGVIEILERGTNESVYSFDIRENAVMVRDTFDATKAVTQVKVVGKQRAEGKPHVDALVSKGVGELGRRQVIYVRPDKETLGEAEAAAERILEENGVKRETKVEVADIPSIRKGDRIRLRTSLGTGYFYVKSVKHTPEKMTLGLDYDGEYSAAQGLERYDLAASDESGSSAPP